MTNLPTDQDHGITISAPDEHTELYTIQRYSDERGAAYELQDELLADEELAALGTYDSECGCFFAYAHNQLNAQLIAGALLERLKAPGLPTLEEQASAENTFDEAAERLRQEHGYSLEDLIEILTSREG